MTHKEPCTNCVTVCEGCEGQTEEHTGGSSSYYDVIVNGQTISCLDIIEALHMDFALGNILKAAWRIAASRNGKKKKGNNEQYDAEKIVFFGERILKSTNQQS